MDYYNNKSFKIIGVTNRKISNNFYGRIEEIRNSKLDYLILREKDLSHIALLEMAIKINKILDESKIKLIINTDIEVAKKINAYGVQLSYKDFADGKRYEGINGVSIHSYDEAIKSEGLGADYLIYGHIFKTDCKKGIEPRGLNEFKRICENVKIPVYGIGGVNGKNYKLVISSGASGIAIMSTLFK